MFSSSSLPNYCIVLERAPEIATGRTLVSYGIKAYGNSRMLKNHFKQMLSTVKNKDIWTYPELTAALINVTNNKFLSDESMELINNRLTTKEIEVVKLILEGLTNDAIASNLDITTRTVKAHVSSIFTKLHVNDRVSLILLLK